MPEKTSGHCWREEPRGQRSKEGEKGAGEKKGRRRRGREGQTENCQKQGHVEGSVRDRGCVGGYVDKDDFTKWFRISQK